MEWYGYVRQETCLYPDPNVPKVELRLKEHQAKYLILVNILTSVFIIGSHTTEIVDRVILF